MIQVHFVDDSHRELMLLVESPPCDANTINMERAPDLLFSVLKRSAVSPRGMAETAAAPEKPARRRRKVR